MSPQSAWMYLHAVFTLPVFWQEESEQAMIIDNPERRMVFHIAGDNIVIIKPLLLMLACFMIAGVL
jgi:hypothetical protein